MDSVSFLQQKIWEINRQIEQLEDKREELKGEITRLRYKATLRKYNLPITDDQV